MKNIFSIAFLFALFLSSQDLFSQSYIQWNLASWDTTGLVGTFSGGTVTVTTSSVGNNMIFNSPAYFGSNVVVTGNETFSTFGSGTLFPSKQLIFNFSTPVIVTRYNMSDIDTDNQHTSFSWNDSFSFVGITFTSAISTNCLTTPTGAIATTDTGGNDEYASWFTSTTPVTSFSLNYIGDGILTHAYLAYSMEVMLPPAQNTVSVNSPAICDLQPATVTATNSAPGNYSYTWTVPAGVANPGNVSTFTTITPGTYTVVVTDLTNSTTSTASGTVTALTSVAPTFTQVNPVCEGTTMTALPTLSNNGVNGTWSPPLNNAQTTTYTFTPNTGECANAVQMTIVVNPKINPSFTQVNPVCEGMTMTALPTLSNNGVNGTWSPPLNNMQTTTYTFTPNTGECANTSQMTIVVNSKKNPQFTQVNPICEGTVLSVLPTLSNNGINGTWSPALNNLQTTPYTFTPNAGECANTAQMTIVVNPKINPQFTQIGPICYGENFSLSTTSTNSISGTWSPVVNSYETTTYAFTPNANECALPSSMQVEVYDDFDFEIKKYCDNGSFLLEVQSIANSFDVTNSNYVWTVNGVSANNNNPVLNITSYLNSTTVIETLPLTVGIKVTNEATNCDKTKQVTLESVYCEIQKGISPNGDTKNDFFDLRLLDVSNLSIFNRYGVKVYEKENYYNEWHGQTNNDKMLPAGVYYYLIEFKNNKESKTGWIYLILEE